MLREIRSGEDFKKVCKKAHAALVKRGVPLSGGVALSDVQEAIAVGLGARNFDGALKFLAIPLDGGRLPAMERAVANPYLEKCPDPRQVTEMLIMLTQPHSDDSSLWRGRMISMVSSAGQVMERGAFCNKSAHEVMNEFLLESVMGLAGHPKGAGVRAYLKSLPGMKEDDDGNFKPTTTAQEQHGYLIMQLTFVLTRLASLEESDPLLVGPGGPKNGPPNVMEALVCESVDLGETLWGLAGGASPGIRISDALVLCGRCLDGRKRELLIKLLDRFLSSSVMMVGLERSWTDFGLG